MNLKRGFLALAAMILGVGFFGAFPQQAHAQHYTPSPPCIKWNVGSTLWAAATTGDTHFFICDGSYQNFQNPSPMAVKIRQQTEAQSAVVRQKMLNKHVDVFVFTNRTAHNSYFSSLLAPPVPDDNTIGWTVLSTEPFGTHTGPSISMMTEVICPITPCQTAQLTDIARVVNHEIGHAIDQNYGLPSHATGPGTFRNQLDADRITFNAQTVNWSGLKQSCTGQPDNWLKLKCALNNPYAEGSDDAYEEWWAHCYATKKSLGSFPAYGSSKLNSYFHKGGMPPSGQNHACDIVTAIAETP